MVPLHNQWTVWAELVERDVTSRVFLHAVNGRISTHTISVPPPKTAVFPSNVFVRCNNAITADIIEKNDSNSTTSFILKIL